MAEQRGERYAIRRQDGDLPADVLAQNGEPTKYRAATARQEAQALETAIQEHAWEAAHWAERAIEVGMDLAADHPKAREDEVYQAAAISQANAAAAGALALLRQRHQTVETR